MMRTAVHGLVVAMLLLALSLPAAAIVPLKFENPAKEARYEALLHQLRCLVCQNQTLATSNAELAAQMRAIVHRMVVAGKSNEQIKDFLVARYGEFVLYRPRLSVKTYLLWFGPLVLAVIGLLVLVVAIRSRWRQAPEAGLDPGERERLRDLLDQYRNQ